MTTKKAKSGSIAAIALYVVCLAFILMFIVGKAQDLVKGIDLLLLGFAT